MAQPGLEEDSEGSLTLATAKIHMSLAEGHGNRRHTRMGEVYPRTPDKWCLS